MKRVIGSYRDPLGYVTLLGDRVFRYCSQEAYADLCDANKDGYLDELASTQKLVSWELLTDSENEIERCEDYPYILVSKKIDLITHPYEWCFLALKKAALFHLDLQIEALKRGVSLVDATAYNIQFHATNPCFIDHLSFKPYENGSYWSAHGQFCEHFLNPLLLKAKCDIDYNQFYQANMDGVDSTLLLKCMKWYHKIQPGTLFHVLIPQLMNSRQKVAKSATTSQFSKEKYMAMLETLKLYIQDLKAKRDMSFWSGYENCHNYNEVSFEEKEDFVSKCIARVKPDVVWDLGCNVGHFSKIALKSGAKKVYAFDLDLDCLNRVFAEAEKENLNILPLYLNLQKPSPSIGWRQGEREGIFERRNANSLLALALIHHMRIACNIPLDQIVSYLLSLSPTGVIEFVPKSDSKVIELLSLRKDIFDDYELENFERLLLQHAKILNKQKLKDSDRVLFEYQRIGEI